MTWSMENSRGNEAAKIRWELVPYFHGRILDIGCGQYKTFPHFIGVDSGKMWGKLSVDAPIEDALKLDLFAGQSCDGVFSSHLLEHLRYEDVPTALNEWFRVIRPGGHLMLYVPDSDEYPKVGELGANPDHRWNCTYENVVEALEQVKCSWDMCDFQKRNQDDEYSLFFVLKKL